MFEWSSRRRTPATAGDHVPRWYTALVVNRIRVAAAKTAVVICPVEVGAVSVSTSPTTSDTGAITVWIHPRHLGLTSSIAGTSDPVAVPEPASRCCVTGAEPSADERACGIGPPDGCTRNRLRYAIVGYGTVGWRQVSVEMMCGLGAQRPENPTAPPSSRYRKRSTTTAETTEALRRHLLDPPTRVLVRALRTPSGQDAARRASAAACGRDARRQPPLGAVRRTRGRPGPPGRCRTHRGSAHLVRRDRHRTSHPVDALHRQPAPQRAGSDRSAGDHRRHRGEAGPHA